MTYDERMVRELGRAANARFSVTGYRGAKRRR
jgi:hypothetical protein